MTEIKLDPLRKETKEKGYIKKIELNGFIERNKPKNMGFLHKINQKTGIY